MTLLEQIQKENAAAFTHGGKFHADDVFSAALLLHFNPQLTIQRGNRVPEDFDGIVFDIGARCRATGSGEEYPPVHRYAEAEGSHAGCR